MNGVIKYILYYNNKREFKINFAIMNKKGGKETILIVFLDSHTQFPII